MSGGYESRRAAHEREAARHEQYRLAQWYRMKANTLAARHLCPSCDRLRCLVGRQSRVDPQAIAQMSLGGVLFHSVRVDGWFPRV